jgi:hypothetical protein
VATDEDLSLYRYTVATDEDPPAAAAATDRLLALRAQLGGGPAQLFNSVGPYRLQAPGDPTLEPIK